MLILGDLMNKELNSLIRKQVFPSIAHSFFDS